MYLIYRHSPSRYTLSSADAEFYREIDAAEAERILRDFGCPEDQLKKIMSESTPGFIMG